MLAFGYIIRTKCPFLMPLNILPTSDALHNLWLPRQLQKPAATALNSTLTMLMVEYGGRANLSGLVDVKLYELVQLMVPNPVYITPASDAALSAEDHALVTRDRRANSGFRMTLTDTRRAMDAAVLDYLGLTQAEQDDIYSAAYEAIVRRQTAEASVT